MVSQPGERAPGSIRTGLAAPRQLFENQDNILTNRMVDYYKRYDTGPYLKRKKKLPLKLKGQRACQHNSRSIGTTIRAIKTKIIRAAVDHHLTWDQQPGDQLFLFRESSNPEISR